MSVQSATDSILASKFTQLPSCDEDLIAQGEELRADAARGLDPPSALLTVLISHSANLNHRHFKPLSWVMRQLLGSITGTMVFRFRSGKIERNTRCTALSCSSRRRPAIHRPHHQPCPELVRRIPAQTGQIILHYSPWPQTDLLTCPDRAASRP